MTDFRNPMYAAEPYQESQGRDSSSAASPDDLVAFYKDMERKEIVERKLSKRKSNSGTSIWSRKSVKRSVTAASAPLAQKPLPQHHPSDSDTRSEKQRGDEEEREMEKLEERKEGPDWAPQMNSPRSIIPDSMKDLPAWYNKEAWSSVPLPSHKLRYNIHNPVGPRWYKNHHLIPSSQVRPAVRPPSVFSPSFPPMASSALQERSEDATRMPGPSRTPSNSPLPTPNSSQTGVADTGGKPRSRKTSQTAHDNVDLLDVTDPWGTNWHHQSPYDIGLGNGPVSVDVQDAMNTRSRRSSMTTAQSRRKTVTPSPLSQSTSAVHLHHPPDASGAHIPRRLSKRRSPGIGNIFGGREQQPERNAVSLPVTPVETIPSHNYSNDIKVSELPRRMSVAPVVGPIPISQTQGVSSKKEKRGSVLGRLAKKFSLMRRSTRDQESVGGGGDDFQHVSTDGTTDDRDIQRLGTLEKQTAPEKVQPDLTKRIPPPSLGRPFSIKPSEGIREADRASSISLETPFSIGRLTIANPDTPGSADTTPTHHSTPLPPQKLEHNGDENHTPAPIHDDDRMGSQPPFLLNGMPDTLSPAVIEKNLPSSPMITNGEAETGPVDTPTNPTSNVSMWPGSPEQQSPPFPRKQKTTLSHPASSSSSVPSRTLAPEAQLQDASGDRSKIPSPQHRTQVTEQRTSHSSKKPQSAPGGPSVTNPTTPSHVPFPAADSPSEYHLHPDRVYSFVYDNSPLSAVSMLANPPTPYTTDISMPSTPEPPPPALPSKNSHNSHREPSPNGQTTSRQTETFRLVRSSSGNVYSSSETIVAAGQQWEVVESLENKGKSRVSSKSKDRDNSSRREQKGENKITADTETEQHHRARNPKLSPTERTAPISNSKRISRVTSSDSRHHDPTKDTAATHKGSSRSSRRRDEDRRSDRKLSDVSSPIILNTNKPQPPPPPPTPAASSRALDRHPSTSARPTSELPSAAEMNALRAKEAWEMERLWKARSMYGSESNGLMAISANNPAAGKHDDVDTQGTVHGSSHTAFMVQTPFQNQHIYHSMPAAPPPIIYSSPPPPSSIQKSAQHTTASHDHTSHRIISDSSDHKSLTSAPRMPLANPLPDPPRESTYEPAPIPSRILDSNSGRVTEYRTKHVGITVAH